MKNIYKYIGLLVIMVFSFYYTDKIALLVQNNNPVMQQINDEKKKLDVSSVNAIIEDDKIIPGKNGKSIDSSKSFSVMKSFGAFNSYYLVFKQTKPKISLEDNKDKIIKSGNKLNKKISFVLDYSEDLISYFEKNKIKADVLINKDNYQNINYLEVINNDFKNYNEMELVLNRSKINKNLCFVMDPSNINTCKSKHKYLINGELYLSNDNVFDIKNEICNGSIIYIKKDTNIDTIKIILNQVKFKGLEIVYLSELISEENND